MTNPANTLPKILSYGGGLDSFAMLVHGIAIGDKPDVVVFCDVAGNAASTDPGEWPSTYKHIAEVAIPLCEKHGIEFVWLKSAIRGERSLYAWMRNRNQIPVSGPARICTRIAKVERFEAWMQERFGSAQVEVWIGFEAGEEARADKDPNAGKPTAQRRNRFPLIEWAMCRCRCESVVRDAGFPIPRKSACVFCPYASKGDWQTLATEAPELFDQVVEMEAAKPLTKRGVKLSIMGFRKASKWKGQKLPQNPVRGEDYKAPALPEFVQGSYKAKAQACGVCGQAQRATKATGCGYLTDDEANGGAGLLQLRASA